MSSPTHLSEEDRQRLREIAEDLHTQWMPSSISSAAFLRDLADRQSSTQGGDANGPVEEERPLSKDGVDVTEGAPDSPSGAPSKASANDAGSVWKLFVHDLAEPPRRRMEEELERFLREERGEPSLITIERLASKASGGSSVGSGEPERSWHLRVCSKHPWARVRLRDGALRCHSCEFLDGVPIPPETHWITVVSATQSKRTSHAACDEETERLESELENEREKVRRLDQARKELIEATPSESDLKALLLLAAKWREHATRKRGAAEREEDHAVAREFRGDARGLETAAQSLEAFFSEATNHPEYSEHRVGVVFHSPTEGWGPRCDCGWRGSVGSAFDAVAKGATSHLIEHSTTREEGR